MDVYDFSGSYESVGEGFKSEAVKTLLGSLGRVEHCVKQLSDDDVWWRADDGMNAIGNIILHSCGNIRQWIIYGCKGKDSGRYRQGEFDQREVIAGGELLRKLSDTVREACDVIASFDDGQMVEACRIQGFDTTVVAAVMHAVSHFEGHAQEVIYITRMRLGGGYEFMWKPEGEEQG